MYNREELRPISEAAWKHHSTLTLAIVRSFVWFVTLLWISLSLFPFLINLASTLR